MVQKQKRRRSSLVMGALLALLLGVAAGFFVLAMPIHMLESVTTFTHLSSLMIQAEPPISPNDRTLLAVLAGVFTAGIGWVLVDWLLFGRAGMRTLIREREDDYEDEEGDAFRPTDPLDLVAPPPALDDWGAPAIGDTRRPLSARTDIGDPPMPSVPVGIRPVAMPGIDQLLPPIDQILPGVGAVAPPILPTAHPPFPHPGVMSDPVQRGAGPLAADVWRSPLISPAENPFAPPPPEAAPAAPLPPIGGGGWLPTPGVRADGSMPSFEPRMAQPEVEPDQEPETEPEPDQAKGEWPETMAPRPDAPIFDPTPLTPAVPPLRIAPDEPAPPTMYPAPPSQEAAYAPSPQPFAPPQPPAWPESPLQPQPEPIARPPIAFDPAPEAPAAPVRSPAAAPAAPTSLFDGPQLGELLARLERGLEKRRAAQGRAAAAATMAAPAAPTPAPAPPRVVDPTVEPPVARQPIAPPEPVVPLPSAAPPPRSEPPAAFTAPEPVAPPVFPMPPVAPPAAFTAPPPVMPTTAPVYDLPNMPLAPAYTLASQPPVEPLAKTSLPQVDEGNGDALLDQPLHVTLELLRNKVKR